MISTINETTDFRYKNNRDRGQKTQYLKLILDYTCSMLNTGINRLRWADDGLQIEVWGDDAHLAGLGEQASTAVRPPR